MLRLLLLPFFLLTFSAFADEGAIVEVDSPHSPGSERAEEHLVLEYAWSERTTGPRSDKARRAHLRFGRDLSILLVEGATGGLQIGERTTPSSKRSKNWIDRRGFQGLNDAANPVGEWNRLEVIRGTNKLSVLVNGVLVNEAAVRISKTGVSLDPDGTRLRLRRFERLNLGTFKEAWKPKARSTDTGYSETGESLLPRREPWSPEKSLAAWQIDGDYELQLVAAEPLVCDPADVVWDAQGRMFVAEIRDYPFPPETGPKLSRIRLLSDSNGDGRMDQATTWADDLDSVQGMIPWSRNAGKDGLLVTTRTAFLYLEDRDEDGIAETRTTLVDYNAARHSQLQIASPRWRLDGFIHLNNGIDGKEFTPIHNERTFETQTIRGKNVRFDPLSGRTQNVMGKGQFGASLDAFGRTFYCSNRNPVMFEVLPPDVVGRNPKAILRTHEDIQPPAAKVWPVELSHTTSIAHAGTHTSACGLMIYGGSTMPELNGNIFVCDPTSQLVTRNRLEANGSSLQAIRVGERRDFLASADEWCRPVNLRNGPDGAIYICDMYRRFIDHAVYFPKAFSASNYMRAGGDYGRIWRLIPKGANAITYKPPTELAGWISELERPEIWRRRNAQRHIVDQRPQDVVAPLSALLKTSEDPVTRTFALWTLQRLERLGLPDLENAFQDKDPGVVENALLIAAERKDVKPAAFSTLIANENARVRMMTAALHGHKLSPAELARAAASGDGWTHRAICSLDEATPSKVLTALLDPKLTSGPEPIRELASFAAADGDTKRLGALLDALEAASPANQSAFVSGFAAGLPRSPFRSLEKLIAKPPVVLKGKVGVLEQALASARDTAIDPSLPTSTRLEALALVKGDLFPLVEVLIAPTQDPALQEAACRSLAGAKADALADFFFERWEGLGPIPRREAITLLSRKDPVTLMKKMKSGDISKTLMPAMSRWSYSRSSNADIKRLALELFGAVNSDRAKVIANYQVALTDGDAERGKAVFAKAACATCHADEDSKRVGPDIRDVRSKPAAALLSDILDPNRVVEDRWTLYTIDTKEGATYAGLVHAESAETVELVLPGGVRQSVQRSEITSMKTQGLSLMPEGLEGTISKAEMSDLIAFLKSR